MTETKQVLDPRLAVLVPCYNAGKRLKPVIEKLLSLSARVILVDDGSTDSGVDPVRELPLQLITFPENRGKGHAMLEGFRMALEDPEVDCVAVLDADGQHDPVELPELWSEFKNQGADLVIGTRTFTRELAPRQRRWSNRFMAWATSLLLKQEIADTQSGYRLHSRRFVVEITDRVRGGRYDTEMEILVMACRKGFKIASVPIRTIYIDGTSSSHFSKRRDPIRIYWTLFRAAWKYH